MLFPANERRDKDPDSCDRDINRKTAPPAETEDQAERVCMTMLLPPAAQGAANAKAFDA